MKKLLLLLIMLASLTLPALEKDKHLHFYFSAGLNIGFTNFNEHGLDLDHPTSMVLGILETALVGAGKEWIWDCAIQGQKASTEDFMWDLIGNFTGGAVMGLYYAATGDSKKMGEKYDRDRSWKWRQRYE